MIRITAPHWLWSTSRVSSQDALVPLFLAAACALLVLLWLPQTRYPIHSDTIDYALLGESVWYTGSYGIFGEPYSKQLPLHAIVSHPFVAILGYGWGMQVSSLIAGMLALIVSFALLREAFSPAVALGGTLALLLHPGFVYTTTVGGADPLFLALFLLAILGYLRAEDDEHFYLLAGIAAMLANFTRFNGVALAPFFFLFTLFGRRAHLRSPWFWGAIVLAAVPIPLWLLRSFLLFRSPLQSGYVDDFHRQVPEYPEEFFGNVLYYLHPLHNVLPVLFPFLLYGIFRFGRRQLILIGAILAALALTLIYWERGMRFALPAFPILLGFAVAGAIDLLHRFPRCRLPLATILVSGVLATHGAFFCLYLYGTCNAFVDRNLPLLPRDLGISTEGYYTWDQARRFLNAHAEPGSQILALDRKQSLVWAADAVFRTDLLLSEQAFAACPLYRITGWPKEEDIIVYATEDAPRMSVVREECPSSQ